MPKPNVIIFGETGSGKSSLVNMIVGHDVATMSSDARGCTFRSAPYSASINGLTIQLWDTAGLNEGDNGRVATKDAIINLYTLIHKMKEGVTLLVFCFRGRIKETTAKNYQMFSSGLCQSNVRIVLVATGLEAESPMDAWWSKNQVIFHGNGMQFFDQVCITTTRGRMRGTEYVYQPEYDESMEKVKRMLYTGCRGSEPWKAGTLAGGWFKTTLKRMFGLTSQHAILRNVLKEYVAGLTDRDADEAVREAEKSIAGL